MSQPATSCSLSRSTEGLHYAGNCLAYRITGLTAYNLDRLRITLKANPPDAAGTFHIDTVDLYNSRGREMFAEACAKYLKAQQATVMAELMQIIAALEAERIAMREGNQPQTPTMTDDEKKEAFDTLQSYAGEILIGECRRFGLLLFVIAREKLPVVGKSKKILHTSSF